MRQRPVNRLIRMTQVAGVDVVIFNHVFLRGRKDHVGTYDVLQAFIDFGHMTVHTARTRSASGVMSVSHDGTFLLVLLVTLDAFGIIFCRRV